MAITNVSKSSSSLSNIAKSLVFTEFLLMESNDFLLLEDGGKIVLNDSATSSTSITNVAKN